MLLSHFTGQIFWHIDVRKDYDIVGSYDNQRISTISAARTVNLFEYNDPFGKRPKTLLSTSGLVNTNLPFGSETGGSRQSFVFKDVIYQIFGGSLFSIFGNTSSLVTSLIGQLQTSVGYVGVDANINQVIFVDGRKGYIYDSEAFGFTEITDPGFPEFPIDVTFLDGFFVVANGNSNNFYLSSLNNGLVWSTLSGTVTAATVSNSTLELSSAFNYALMTPVILSVSGGGVLPTGLTAGTIYYVIPVSSNQIKLAATKRNAVLNIPIAFTTSGTIPTITITNSGQLQFGSITSHPGNIVACRTLHRRLFLFSNNYTEVWENAGLGTNLPFRRTNSLLMEVGTPSVGSIAVGFDKMFFLSQDKDGLGAVMEVRGAEAIPVSNRALDYQLAQYASESTNSVTHVADSRGILIKENGLIFYRLNFTLANHTYVLNDSMSTPEMPLWHEEEILNGDRHPAQTHIYYKGVNYYGDYSQSKLYIVDTTVSTNDGEAIRRMRIGRPISPEGYNRLRIDRFHLDVLQGQQQLISLNDIFLTTEGGDPILTENGDELLIEQQVEVANNENPIVYFSYSKDGGQSYGYYLPSTMGKIGERTYRTVWRKLGTIPRGQSFTPRFEFYNEIPFIILGAAWDFEVLPE
jgi:hypothetical protein